MNFICKWVNSVIDGETGKSLEYYHLIKCPKYKEEWGISFGNEIGRLCQGTEGRAAGTDTMFCIDKSKVPKDHVKDVTYGKINCHYREQKD